MAQRNATTFYSIALLGLLWMCSWQAFAQGEEALTKLYRQAVAAEQQSDYPSAARLYGQIIAIRPDMAEAHANLGNLQYLQGQFDAARLSFARALKLKPELAGPRFFLGVLAFRSNDFAEAETQFTKAAALDPANPQIQLHLGYTYYGRGQYAKAIACFQRTLSADPQNEDAWYHLSKGASQESRRYLAQLQQTDPQSYFARLAQAHFFEGQGNWLEAAQSYTKASQIKPSEPLQRKIAYLEARGAGKESATVPTDEEIDGSTIFLYNPPAPSDLPTIYRTLSGKLDSHGSSRALSPQELYGKAESYQLLAYVAALSVSTIAPESYRTYQLKAQALEAAGRGEEAIAEYRKALEKNPQLRTVHFAIGNILWAQGNLADALPELSAELALSPNDPETHYEIGDILFTQGKLEEAASHLLSNLKYSPKTVEAHLALERIYTSLGNSDKAVYHLAQASKIAPAEATPHYRLWVLYRKQGKTEEAERERAIFQKLKQQTATAEKPASAN